LLLDLGLLLQRFFFLDFCNLAQNRLGLLILAFLFKEGSFFAFVDLSTDSRSSFLQL
jgi:hypothetical protein